MKLRENEEAVFRDLKWAMDKTNGNDKVRDAEYQTRIDLNLSFSEKERLIIQQTYAGDEEKQWLDFEGVDSKFRIK